MVNLNYTHAIIVDWRLTMRRRILTLLPDLLFSVLLTVPLMALLYLADHLAGLPFPPYDVFDWLARTLPGDVIGKTIETMVTLIRRLNLGETSSTAKRIETLNALALFFGGGVVGGVVLLALVDRTRSGLRLGVAALAGAVLSLPLILITRTIDSATAAPLASALWILAATIAWSTALYWTHARYAHITATPPPQIDERTVTMHMISRRQFLIQVGGAAATLTIAGAGIGRVLSYLDERDYRDQVRRNREAAAQVEALALPNRDDPVVPAPGTRPEYTPLEDHYRIDINLRPVEIDGDTWRLNIDGLVDHPLALSLDDLKQYEEHDQYVTLACISNPLGGDLTSTTRWTGVSVRDVLADAGLRPGATHLKITAEDGFFETVDLDLVNSDPRVMFAYNWDGIPLLHDHGFPLRIYIPDRYGMKQPKWITHIEVMDHDEDGYWVVRGWDKVARMRATSVVDVVADDARFDADGRTLIPIGGIAHAGARGISKVEIKIDDGDWAEARLRAPLSETTWVVWRYDWPFEEGRHTFYVRCYEADGTPQIEREASTHPSGATGLDRLTRTVA